MLYNFTWAIFDHLSLYVRAHKSWLIFQLNFNIVLNASDEAYWISEIYNQLILWDIWWYLLRVTEYYIDFHHISLIAFNRPSKIKAWFVESNILISFVLRLHINQGVSMIYPGSIHACVHHLIEFYDNLPIHVHLCRIPTAFILLCDLFHRLIFFFIYLLFILRF